MNAQTRQLHALTSLRIFFAAWVLAFHWFSVSALQTKGFLDIGTSIRVLDKGYLGVDGFFVLSGFILAYTYACTHVSGSFDYRSFIVNRLARIYPIHLTCLVLIAAVFAANHFIFHKPTLGERGNTLGKFSLDLALLTTWVNHDQHGWNDVAWSVSAEWFAYVAFPAFLIVARLQSPVALLTAMLASFCTLFLAEAAHGSAQLNNPIGLIRLIPEFLIGVGLFGLREALPWLQSVRFGSILSLCVMASGILINSDTLCVAGMAGLVMALASYGDVLVAPLSTQILVYLGEVSFCIYMFQRIPERLFSAARKRIDFLESMPTFGALILVGIATIGGAMLLHHMVEKPMRNMIRSRFAPRPITSPQVA